MCLRWVQALLLAAALLSWPPASVAQPASGGGNPKLDSLLAPMDSVVLSLLTCSPHDEVYSLYGHTAVRMLDLRNGMDVVYNYGIFNFKAPHFVARFVFGKTDYELGKFPTAPFLAYYSKWGSQVTEQTLNLTRQEKLRLLSALEENYRPENRVYRYNIFFDNCSTRPRDIIERCVDGSVGYQQAPQDKTWRQLLHEKTWRHAWATFGNDMLLGLGADGVPTLREREFLPEWLMADFRTATIVGGDGRTRPLVSGERALVAKGVQGGPMLPPSLVTAVLPLLLLAFTLLLCLRHRRESEVPLALRLHDMALLTVMGVIGCILTVMSFSDHPFTSPNLLLLAFNPLLFLLLPSAWRGGGERLWGVACVLAGACMVAWVWQGFPPLAAALASCLLLRSYMRAAWQRPSAKQASGGGRKRKDIVTH